MRYKVKRKMDKTKHLPCNIVRHLWWSIPFPKKDVPDLDPDGETDRRITTKIKATLSS